MIWFIDVLAVIMEIRWFYSVLLIMYLAVCGFFVAGLQGCSSTVIPIHPGTVGPSSTTSTVSSTTCSCSSPDVTTVVTPSTRNDSLMVPLPRFSSDNGNLPIGTLIRLLADSIPSQGTLEYSADGGAQWITASQFVLKNGGTYLARIRAGSRVSRSKSATFNLSYSNVVIMGNSIMLLGPDAAVGWPYNHGMAASAPDKDFVHLLTYQLQQRLPSVKVTLSGGYLFESSYWKITLNEYDHSFSEKPDLTVVRIAENVDDNQVSTRNFEVYYRQLLTYIADHSATTHKIVCTTSFWDQPHVDAVIRKVAAEKGYPLACLCDLVNKPEYRASQFSDPGVAAHPNDKGMAEIARLIWEKAQ
ncbi:SGNH/GDSL hydrolase family protein [Fibrella forsythiae]|uniref:SGNH/GDSL hydrolase family protein n=1 Tax=Fibrella forsythiae TaxID=2817061 RepID=A0ABS3JEX2_9BACT|nr:SGNH/GDSL hydrolase family protein [Fibrella forsythiae]MBO0948547.1 SGNH/GDSL hydrolase family protein [Fibrella forsythiae]